MNYKRSFTVCLLLSFVLFIALIFGWTNVINLNETQYDVLSYNISTFTTKSNNTFAYITYSYEDDNYITHNVTTECKNDTIKYYLDGTDFPEKFGKQLIFKTRDGNILFDKNNNHRQEYIYNPIVQNNKTPLFLINEQSAFLIISFVITILYLFSLFGVVNTYYDYAYYEDGEFSDIFRNEKLKKLNKKLNKKLINNIKRFFGYGNKINNIKTYVKYDTISAFINKLNIFNIEIINNTHQDLSSSIIVFFEIIGNKAYVIDSVNIFNNLKSKFIPSNEVLMQPIIDVEQQLSKMIDGNIYYVTAFDDEENEYWLFKYKQNDSLIITSGESACFKDKKCVYTNKYCRTVIKNHEINFIREATPEEIELFETTIQKINNNYE